MVKTVPLKFSDEEHSEITQIKNTSGLNWEQFVIAASKVYEMINNDE